LPLAPCPLPFASCPNYFNIKIFDIDLISIL
jgi:hypothetical protein